MSHLRDVQQHTRSLADIREILNSMKSLAYMEDYNITYPNGPDRASAISDEYRITGVPETFFIAKDGTIAEVVVGPVNASMLDRQIAQLISE